MFQQRLRTIIAGAAMGGAALLAAASPLWAAEPARPSQKEAAEAAALRKEISNLPHLVRTTPNIYLIRVEKVETAGGERRAPGGESQTAPPSEVTASVMSTLKGKSREKLNLTVRQRRAGAAGAGLFGGDVSGDPSDFQESPAFFSVDRFLSPLNPMFGGPNFRKDRTYLVFTDINAEELLGGPYGYQAVTSPKDFWVRTVEGLVSNPDSSHAVEMTFPEFVRKYRSAFVMVVEDCLGTEVSISDPLWGAPVSRDDIYPARILPESAADCADAMDQKRGYLGLIESRPWLYQMRRGYPNQVYLEIRDGNIDFSELDLDIGFPDGGKISVAELAEQMSEGPAR